MLGGEPIAPELIQSWLSSQEDIEIINSYGPTESTDVTHYYRLPKQNKRLKNIPIGRAVWNTSHYILDGDLNLVPKGITGELFIGSVGLARGYLNQPVLTQERFIANPFYDEGIPNSSERSVSYTHLTLPTIYPV